MSADKVAREILLGIQRNKYVILPGSETKWLFHLGGLLGNAVYSLMDMMIKNARHSISTEEILDGHL